MDDAIDRSVDQLQVIIEAIRAEVEALVIKTDTYVKKGECNG